MSIHKDRLRALGGGLRRGYTLAEAQTDRQFEELLRQLAQVPLCLGEETNRQVD